MPTKEDSTNQVVDQKQVSITSKLLSVNAKLHSIAELHLGTKLQLGIELQSRIELHSRAKLQNEENAHSDYKISTHGRDVETPDRDAHSDTEAERQSVKSRTKPVLSKYVKRHHPTDQTIRAKDVRPMTRNRLRSEAYLLSMKEPKIVKDALEDDDQYKALANREE